MRRSAVACPDPVLSIIRKMTGDFPTTDQCLRHHTPQVGCAPVPRPVAYRIPVAGRSRQATPRWTDARIRKATPGTHQWLLVDLPPVRSAGTTKAPGKTDFLPKLPADTPPPPGPSDRRP